MERYLNLFMCITNQTYQGSSTWSLYHYIFIMQWRQYLVIKLRLQFLRTLLLEDKSWSTIILVGIFWEFPLGISVRNSIKLISKHNHNGMSAFIYINFSLLLALEIAVYRPIYQQYNYNFKSISWSCSKWM